MNELAVRNNQTEISKILNSEAGNKRLSDFFNGDTEKIQRFKTNLINIAGNYILTQCTPNSIIRSAFALADIGLDINQTLKQAYILKYANDAEPVISYKGWQVLLRKGGKNTRAFCVYRCDKFSLNYNSFEGDLEFQPNYQERNETDREWFYKNLLGVVVKIKEVKGGLDEIFFVSAKKIDKIKGCSPSVKRGKSSPYDEWFEEMYLAKAIKYVLSKQAFVFENDKLSEAIEMESNIEAKIQQNEQKMHEVKDFDELLSSDSGVRDMVKNLETETEFEVEAIR
ncbi:recombinase RecT [Helicobacter rodentium]|uniref:recombinase RecT n=2 Tax=Helicobacter rodentium TaxID=59617 RepID=UPI0026021B40|nr:recombinase RecT [Helicobacter rodentium]